MRPLVLNKGFFHIIKSYFFPIIIAVLLGLFIRIFMLEVYKVPTSSMAPTLLPGDHIAVFKLSYNFRFPFTDYFIKFSFPKRGDLIIFKRRKDEDFYVKRIVALPNERVSTKNGLLFINNLLIKKTFADDTVDYSYLEHNDIIYNEKLGDLSHYVIYNKETVYNYDFSEKLLSTKGYFLMGDNRTNSEDSRVWGEVAYKEIVGKVVFIWFSVDPETGSVRWNRIGIIK